MVCACCYVLVCHFILSGCGVSVCGRECAGDGTPFLISGGVGVCTRTDTVEFRMMLVRYGMQLI